MRHDVNLVFRSERGIALPVALFGLVVVGALVAGIFFTARTEVRSGENVMSGARAMEAAQAGLQMGYPKVIRAAGALSNGQTAALPKTQLGTTRSFYQDSVTRLNKFMFLLRSRGTYEPNGQVLASRTLGMLVKRYVPEVNVNASLIVRGPATASGSSTLNGHDAPPPGWTDCPPSTRFEPALRSAETVSNAGSASIVGPAPPDRQRHVGGQYLGNYGYTLLPTQGAEGQDCVLYRPAAESLAELCRPLCNVEQSELGRSGPLLAGAPLRILFPGGVLLWRRPYAPIHTQWWDGTGSASDRWQSRDRGEFQIRRIDPGEGHRKGFGHCSHRWEHDIAGLRPECGHWSLYSQLLHVRGEQRLQPSQHGDASDQPGVHSILGWQREWSLAQFVPDRTSHQELSSDAHASP